MGLKAGRTVLDAACQDGGRELGNIENLDNTVVLNPDGTSYRLKQKGKGN